MPKTQETPTHFSVFNVRTGVTWLGSVLLQPNIKQGWGEPRECGQAPHQQQSINLQHSLPDAKPKPTLMKTAKKRGQQEVTLAPFLNPDPIAHLVGCSNEAPVVVDRQEVTALIDLGAQVSSISAQFCKDLALQIQSLDQLELEGTGVQLSHTLDLWRLTSKFWGSVITMRCAVVGYPHHNLLQNGSSHGGF